MSDLDLVQAARALASAQIELVDAESKLVAFERDVSAGKFARCEVQSLVARHAELLATVTKAEYQVLQRREQYQAVRVETIRERDVDTWIEILSARITGTGASHVQA